MDGSCQPNPRYRVGYVVSRFPKLSETFILREMDALERLGWQIDLFPFIRLQEPVRHAQTDRWLARLGKPDTMAEVVLANIHWLRYAPLRMVSLYALVARGLWRHPGELARGLVAVARAALWARRVRERGIAHLHAHFALHPALAALAAAHLAGVTYSFTCHAQDVYRQPALLGEKARRARFVVAISYLLRDRYLAPHLRPVDRARVRVIRCGVDVAHYRQRSDPARSGRLVILAVARLAEKKGLGCLIDACALLRDRGYVFSCRIIGDGPLRARLQERIQAAGLGGCVRLEGPRPQDAVLEALEGATVVAQPSIVTEDGDMEGVPVSLMEAMAVGVPVVATRTGAISELVEDGQTGLLVPPGDPLALAEAIARLAEDPDLVQRLVHAARRHIEKEFDLDKNVVALDELLHLATASGCASHTWEVTMDSVFE